VNFLQPDPMYFLLPGLFIFTFVLACNLLGDGLRDALDPKADRT
jgi:peptide/nickel transport system permease protein